MSAILLVSADGKRSRKLTNEQVADIRVALDLLVETVDENGQRAKAIGLRHLDTVIGGIQHAGR